MIWTNPSAFDWGNNPPLSSATAVISTSVCYVAFVIISTTFSRRYLPLPNEASATSEKNKHVSNHWKPWFGTDMKLFQFIHNVNLVLSSAIMLLGVLYEACRRMMVEQSSFFMFCEEKSISLDDQASGAIYYWSYIYYLSKYYELLDTILQLCRGKPPPHFALHVYHHAVVLFMGWIWLETKQSLQFIGLMFNTAVHVVMYTYFLQRTITSKVPKWKNFVTMFQIVQFVVSVIVFLITVYYVKFEGYECSGMKGLYFNVIFNVTLLHSFVGVLVKSKKKMKAKTV